MPRFDRWCSAGLAALLGVSLGSGACSPGAFVCSGDDECSGGRCEPTGYCSFESTECPSGRRYGKHGPSEIAGECVPPGETAVDTSGQESSATSAETTGSEEMTSSTTSPTSSTSTTSPGDTGSASMSGSATETGDDTAGNLDCEIAFVDAFETDVLDDSWWIWTAGDAGEVTLSSGFAVFSIPASDDAWVSIVLDLDGFEDEAVIVELEGAASDPKAYVWFEVTGSTKYEFGLVDHGLQVRAGASSNPDVLAELPYDPVAHRFLRIRAVRSGIEWGASANGSTWETLYTVPADAGERPQTHRTAFGLGTRVDLAQGAEASLARFVRCK